MSITSPEVAGLLYKRRGGFGKMMPNSWQYRFFAITKDGILYYFDTENADAEFDIGKARGRLELKAISYDYSIDPIEGAPTNYAIQIGIPNEEKWKLCADNKEIQARWCKVLDKFMVEKVISPKSQKQDEHSEFRLPESNPESKVNDKLNPVMATATAEQSENFSHQTIPSGIQASNGLRDLISTTAPPSNANDNVKPGRKSRLKLAYKRDIIDHETFETLMVLCVVNVAFFALYLSKGFLLRCFYVISVNVVVSVTLRLRSDRAQKALNSSNVSDRLLSQETKENFSSEDGHSSLPKTTDAVESLVNSNHVASGPPIPGCTLELSKNEPKLSPPHTWSPADHRQFSVRIGPDYNRFKKKAPSASPIYEPFAVDVFCAKKRIDHAASRFQLPDTTNIQTNNEFVPPIFVVQIQIPSEPPSSFFSSSEDGPGWAVVMYFKITEDACGQLKDLSTASPAVKLFAEWCEKAPVDPAWRGRFKVINSCTNIEELGFPSMIVSYNAKPVLIRRTGTIFRGQNYMEMDIHVHKFANVAKQSIYLISSRCALMYMQIGFVIEGREDRELPETLFACVGLNKPQEDQAEFIFDE